MDLSKLSPAGQSNAKSCMDGKPIVEELQRLCDAPMKKNEELLMQILKDNQDTEYGRKYHFAEIKSIEDYQRMVPVSEYDDYADYIYRMVEGNESHLMTAYNIIHYSKSSGTMGNPKKIPFTDRAAGVHDIYNAKYVYGLLSGKIGIEQMNGRAMNVIESSMKTLKNGVTYGAFSAKVMYAYKDFISMLMTSPIEALLPDQDTDTKYLHARFALMDADIASMNAAFLGFIVDIMKYIENNWEMLAEDIEKGTIHPSIRMPEQVRQSVTQKLQPMPERAAELRAEFEKGFDTLIGPRIWKKLTWITGVGSGGFKAYKEVLINRYLGDQVYFYLSGLTASEGLFSVPYELNNDHFIFVPDSMFYEFRSVEDDNYDHLLTLDQLEVGRDYEIITTNLSGFYRYKMDDVVRITGKVKNMPTMEFLYRQKQTVSLMGEKTTEVALREAAYKTARKMGIDLLEYCVYPNIKASPVEYEFLFEAHNIPDGISIEQVREELERQMAIANPSYGDKVVKGVMGSTKLFYLQEETHQFYREMMIKKGTSSAQLKPVRVIGNETQRRFFFALLDH